MFKVRTRYAPSPTGVPHIGNIRTALFNFLFAKNQSGEFVLRIEDTDRKRLVPGSIEAIKESLKQLNLLWDGKVFLQSERLELYNEALKELKAKELVYEQGGAWFFKVPKGKLLKWKDEVHGQIQFKSEVVEDFVVVKSDNFPTYHFASVVDDHQMQISHVIRGDEWISSTPKHLLLYEALGWQPPQYVHVPPIVGTNKKKLSKRDGAKSVLEYIKEGYLPETLSNFLALLGWSPKGDRELFSLQELIEEFSLERLNKNNPIFNTEKLKWFNGQWIRRLEEEEFLKMVTRYYPNYQSSVTRNVALLTKDRLETLADYKKIANFFYARPKEIPPVRIPIEAISHVALEFGRTSSWEAVSIKELIEKTAEADNLDRIGLISGIRNIISGSTVTPPLYESLERLGQKETVERLENYVKKKSKK